MPSPATTSPFLMLGGAWLAGTALALLTVLVTDRAPGRFARACGLVTLSALLFSTGAAQAWQTAQERPRTVRIDPQAPACPPGLTGCGSGHADTAPDTTTG